MRAVIPLFPPLPILIDWPTTYAVPRRTAAHARSASSTLGTGRSAHWRDETMVICNSHAVEVGTTFRPAGGDDYFLNVS